jgi:hypothetical protein
MTMNISLKVTSYAQMHMEFEQLLRTTGEKIGHNKISTKKKEIRDNEIRSKAFIDAADLIKSIRIESIEPPRYHPENTDDEGNSG